MITWSIVTGILNLNWCAILYWWSSTYAHFKTFEKAMGFIYAALHKLNLYFDSSQICLFQSDQGFTMRLRNESTTNISHFPNVTVLKIQMLINVVDFQNHVKIVDTYILAAENLWTDNQTISISIYDNSSYRWIKNFYRFAIHLQNLPHRLNSSV